MGVGGGRGWTVDSGRGLRGVQESGLREVRQERMEQRDKKTGEVLLKWQ